MKLYRFGMATASLLLLAAALPAYGSSTHTWVSATGNNSNAGTPTSPYADFATAVANTAAGGTISVMGPGDYGPVIITQSVTIDGTGGGSINIPGEGQGIFIVPGSAANIVLRNLSINGGGTGADAIYIQSAGTTNTINVVIDGCFLGGFTFIGVAVGSESPMYVTVKNTTIQGGEVGVRTFQNGTTAPVAIYAHVSLDHVNIQGASGSGVFTRNGNVDISNSNIAGIIGSGATGVQADTYATINVQNTMITSSTNGACVYAGSTAILNYTTVADNATNIEYCGGQVEGPGGAGPSPEVGAPSQTGTVPPDRPRILRLRR